MASREVTITAAAQIARERRGRCREVTVTARGRGTAAAEWLITLKVIIICMESIDNKFCDSSNEMIYFAE
jgi:hypothetical protein